MAPAQFDPKAMVDFDNLWSRGLFPDAEQELEQEPVERERKQELEREHEHEQGQGQDRPRPRPRPRTRLREQKQESDQEREGEEEEEGTGEEEEETTKHIVRKRGGGRGGRGKQESEQEWESEEEEEGTGEEEETTKQRTTRNGAKKPRGGKGESDSVLFPERTKLESYDFGTPNDAEFFVESIEGHEWRNRGKNLHLLIRWTLGEATWAPLEDAKDLKALDEYLQLAGVTQWQDLPKVDDAGREHGKAHDHPHTKPPSHHTSSLTLNKPPCPTANPPTIATCHLPATTSRESAKTTINDPIKTKTPRCEPRHLDQ
ncbi:hypothetical protein K435DRAFT_867073 [Dendrothele bispora CBS 962.96]|uniref:Chromo domain-containing protein n=1 Tax=Dendrothele bispora (strain CBS 962.96) TaxID=1314807 RepID=A0A4S8LFS3_DENBC|nr:hypothetical protein K435DRAFT_867073 [Dendrothele bispora CBS 962.96]